MVNATHVRFSATVPNNHYFSIGFGSTMYSTDMVVWQANSQNSLVLDLWSTGHQTPITDKVQNYVSTIKFNSTHTSFISDRALQTGDSQDFTITKVITIL